MHMAYIDWNALQKMTPLQAVCGVLLAVDAAIYVVMRHGLVAHFAGIVGVSSVVCLFLWSGVKGRLLFEKNSSNPRVMMFVGAKARFIAFVVGAYFLWVLIALMGEYTITSAHMFAVVVGAFLSYPLIPKKLPTEELVEVHAITKKDSSLYVVLFVLVNALIGLATLAWVLPSNSLLLFGSTWIGWMVAAHILGSIWFRPQHKSKH
jgi:hypothetical protein